MPTRRPHVTDHALVRYLERVEGIDVIAARRAIEEAVRQGVETGADAVLLDGMRYCLQNRAVVTVKKIGHPDQRTGGHRGKRGDHGG